MKKRLVILGMICTMLLSCTACSDSISTSNSTSNIDYGIANVDMTSHNSYDTYDGTYKDTYEENGDSTNGEGDSTNVEGNSENEEVSTSKNTKNIEDKLVYSYNVEYSVYGEKNKKKAIE